MPADAILTVRLPADLKAAVEDLAKRRMQSAGALVRQLIADEVKRGEDEL